jgi:hypothetical protein
MQRISGLDPIDTDIAAPRALRGGTPSLVTTTTKKQS